MILFDFLTKKEAYLRLSVKDEFIKNLNYESIHFFHKKHKTVQQYRDNFEKEIIPFTQSEKKLILGIQNEINERLKQKGFHYNGNVCFVKTNGEDANHLPYTRGNIIVLPNFICSTFNLFLYNKHLIVHELFHILTRSFPELRNDLYHSIGFVNAGREIISNQYLPSMIINPDALHFNWFRDVEHKGKIIKIIPVLVKLNHLSSSSIKELVISAFGRPICKLLVLDSKGHPTGKLLAIKETNYESYYRTISSYMIHPEEICAELFRRIMFDDVANLDHVLSDKFMIGLRKHQITID